jgi:hypothetical protein
LTIIREQWFAALQTLSPNKSNNMAVDENGNEIIETTPAPQPQVDNRSQERIKQLSEKVELTAKERDELKVLNETTTRERDFYKGYSEIVATHPNAKDHQDEIKEKVLKGYSVQDATFAVLGAAGKLGNQPTPTPQVAGGSAATAMPQGGQKEIKDMSQAERREQLAKDLLWN